jgi:hypothetical protein
MPWRRPRRYRVPSDEIEFGRDADQSIIGTRAWPVEVWTKMARHWLPANTLPVHGAAGSSPVGDAWRGIQAGPQRSSVPSTADSHTHAKASG